MVYVLVLFISFIFSIFSQKFISMVEEWRQIKDYPNYEVSNMGGWRNTKRNYQPKGRICNGYITVCTGKGTKENGLHTLVAKYFPEICGEWFDGCQVHHKNFNKLDNRAENLIVLSASEHLKLHYKTQSDLFKKASVKRSASISKALKGRKAIEKYTPILQFSLDGYMLKKWDSGVEVAKTLNKSQGNISSCCKGILKSAYGYIWKYYNLDTYLIGKMYNNLKNKGIELRKGA